MQPNAADNSIGIEHSLFESPPQPPATTPLPVALPLFAIGLGDLGLLGWHRMRKAKAAA